MSPINTSKIEAFRKKIFDWWVKNKRELPWRQTEDPYKIMVSEIMLQQTQVSRTIEKYLAFIEIFPTFKALADASPADVLTLWSGLGYNRRALWLQEAAKEIFALGEFPKTPDALIKIKGIGPYTSRSILIFAFNQDVATIDTNIRRILIAEGFADEETTEKELFLIADQIYPKGRSRDWHNALMDYGSLEVTARKTGIKPVTQQPKYKKSGRFYRGRVVKYLTENKKATLRTLVKKCAIPEDQKEKIIDSLVKDGLILKKKTYYHLP
ncbi:MAG: Fe-S cluster assembly protein HesB [Candidatus Heimdallarchaeota archaeon]